MPSSSGRSKSKQNPDSLPNPRTPMEKAVFDLRLTEGLLRARRLIVDELIREGKPPTEEFLNRPYSLQTLDFPGAKLETECESQFQPVPALPTDPNGSVNPASRIKDSEGSVQL